MTEPRKDFLIEYDLRIRLPILPTVILLVLMAVGLAVVGSAVFPAVKAAGCQLCQPKCQCAGAAAGVCPCQRPELPQPAPVVPTPVPRPDVAPLPAPTPLPKPIGAPVGAASA